MSNKRIKRTGKKARRNQKIVLISTIAGGAALIFVIALVIWLTVGKGSVQDTQLVEEEPLVEASNEKITDEIFEEALEEEEEKNSEYINPETIAAVVRGGKKVSDALSKRPATVEMTDENRSEFANIVSCNIVDGSKVEVSVTSEGIPKIKRITWTKFYFF